MSNRSNHQLMTILCLHYIRLLDYAMSDMAVITTFKKAANPFPRCCRIPFHNGFSTLSKDSMPYGVAASARAARARAVMVRTFCCSSTSPETQAIAHDLQNNFTHIKMSKTIYSIQHVVSRKQVNIEIHSQHATVLQQKPKR